MALNHHIKQLRVALSVPDQETANDLQQAVSTFCRTDLDGVLEGAFDTVSPRRWLRIDRLELGLPAFRSADEFRDKLGDRVREAILARLLDAEAATADPEAAPGKRKQTPKSFDRSYQAADTFIHMLQYGVAPWHATKAAFDEVVSHIIPLLESDSAFKSQLADLLSGPGPVLRRFILQTATPHRLRIVSLIAGTADHVVSEAEGVADAFAKVLTRTLRSVLPIDFLPGQAAVRHLIRYRRLDSEVVGSILKEVTIELLHADTAQRRQIIEGLPLAGMELEAVLPVRWREAVRTTMADFAAQAHDHRQGTGGIGPPPSMAPQTPPEKTIADTSTGKPPSGAMPEEMDASAGEARCKEGDAPRKSHGKKQSGLESRPPVAPADESEPTQAGQARAEADGKSTSLEPPRPIDTTAYPVNRSENATATGRRIKKPQGAPRDGIATERPLDAMEGRSEPTATGHRIKKPAVAPRDGSATGRPSDAMGGRSEPTAGTAWMTPYDAEAFHIHNAGLVLVAPFFRLVFKDLGYLKDGRGFATGEAKARAVHFSQHVVTAKPNPAECDLVLNKIVCGMEVDEPVERFLDLSDREREAAEDVLKSAIEHWTVLKRTSVAVFRQTFLQHDGILTRAGGHWLLRIERISADVLIDTLPWTISIIKHPWMQQPVMVEW